MPGKPDAADRHRYRGLRRFDDGNADRILERLPVTRHAGATHHYDVGSVTIAQFPAHLDQPAKCTLCVGELCHAQSGWQLGGQSVRYAQSADIAPVTPYRLPPDTDDAEFLPERERGHDRALRDAQHGLLRDLAE